LFAKTQSRIEKLPEEACTGICIRRTWEIVLHPADLPLPRVWTVELP